MTPHRAQVPLEPRRVSYTFPREAMDEDALAIVRRLNHAGHTSYFVGGCVRDVLLGKIPKDFDVATSALPQQVRRVFRNAQLIGRRFKLAHVHCKGGKIIEVATFRQAPSQSGVEDGLIVDDNEYGTPETDAFRRDFTINALFYDPLQREIIDFVDGLDDIERRLIRSIGDPRLRFREDPVRILRAIKFAGKLDLNYEDAVTRAIDSERDSLVQAAPPRLQQELLRYLQGGSAVRTYQLLEESGALQLILPELDALFEAHPSARAELYELLRVQDMMLTEGAEWSALPKEEVALALLWWPIASRLILGELYSPSEREHGSEVQLHYDPQDLSFKDMRFTVIRLIAPFCTRVGLSLKGLYSISRVISVQLLLELELYEPRLARDQVSSLRSHLSGAHTYEVLLFIKTRHRAGLASSALWEAVEPLWEKKRRQVLSARQGSGERRTLVPSVPVIKPKERRRRKRRAH